MTAITKRTVDAAEPAERDRFVWDSDLSGFGLKVTPAGGKVYIVQYRTGGRGASTRRVTIGKHGAPWTPDQARKKAKAILGEVAAGRDPAGEKRAERQRTAPANTVRAVVAEWLRRDQNGNRTADEARRVMEHDVLPRWGDRPIQDIRKRDVIELVDAVADRGAPIQANRVLAYVRRLLNWAAGRDIIEANPAQFVEKPGRERKRERVLSDAELVAIWHACETIGYPFGRGVQLLVLTGARRDEIFGSSWPEIDLDGAAIRLPAERSKTAEGRTIPLSRPALDLVAALPSFTAGDSVLSLNGVKPYTNFGHAKAAIDRQLPELEPWRLHDIRRSVATGLQRLGARLEAIEALLGHVSGSRAGVVGVYQRHRFEAEARAAAEAWGQHMTALLEDRTADVVPLAARR